MDETIPLTECVEFDVIRRFFRKQKWPIGGSVPEELLFNPKNVEYLEGYKNKDKGLVHAVNVAYAAFEQAKLAGRDKYQKKNIGQYLIPRILHACGRRGVPRNYVGGVMLVYLEVIERLPIRSIHAKKQNKINGNK